MIDDFEQNFIGTIRVLNKKPVIAKLIRDIKFVSAKGKFEPHFQNAVRDIFGNFRAFQIFDVIGNFVEKNYFRHIHEMPRTVVHLQIK